MVEVDLRIPRLTSTLLELLAWSAIPIRTLRTIMMRISTTLPMTQAGVPDIAMARRLEDLGYDSISMADFILGDGTPSFDATLVLAAAATVTDKIGLESAPTRSWPHYSSPHAHQPPTSPLCAPATAHMRNGSILATMVIVDVVMETYDAVDFTAWPIAKPSSDRLLALSGRMSPADVGTAMAVIFSYNNIPVTQAADLTEAHLEQHLAEAGALIAPGGLRFLDTTTGVSIAAGCCFGLENWRDWWDVARGQEPWLGHDPTPHITHVGRVIKLRQLSTTI